MGDGEAQGRLKALVLLIIVGGLLIGAGGLIGTSIAGGPRPTITPQASPVGIQAPTPTATPAVPPISATEAVGAGSPSCDGLRDYGLRGQRELASGSGTEFIHVQFWRPGSSDQSERETLLPPGRYQVLASDIDGHIWELGPTCTVETAIEGHVRPSTTRRRNAGYVPWTVLTSQGLLAVEWQAQPVPELPDSLGDTAHQASGNTSETLNVPGAAEAGVTFTAPETGTYAITIVAGAYSPWPRDNDAHNQWRTLLYIYRDRAIEWGDRGYGLLEPFHPDYSLGLWENDASLPAEAAAAEAGKGSQIHVDLQAGDRLLFVPIDQQGAYASPAPNRGSVTVTVASIDPAATPCPAWGPAGAAPQTVGEAASLLGTMPQQLSAEQRGTCVIGWVVDLEASIANGESGAVHVPGGVCVDWSPAAGTLAGPTIWSKRFQPDWERSLLAGPATLSGQKATLYWTSCNPDG